MDWKRRYSAIVCAMLLLTSVHAQDDFVVIDGDTLYSDSTDPVEAIPGEENARPPETLKTPTPGAISKQTPWSLDQLEKARGKLDYTRPGEKPPKKKSEPEQQPVPEYTPPVEEPDSNFLGTPLAQAIVLSVIIVLLAWLIYRLLSHGKGMKDGKLTQPVAYTFGDTQEDLRESDLEARLRLALDEALFKEAIRLYYLQVIKRLHEKKYIVWSRGKTNVDYLAEMRPRSGFGTFRELTRLYEFIWYGDTGVNRIQFEATEPLFRNFLEQLNKAD